MDPQLVAKIEYRVSAGTEVPTAAALRVYESSGLGERRPLDEPGKLRAMLDGANLVACAFADGDLIGLARTITDHTYVTYVADVAVDSEFQRRGVGRRLLDELAQAAPTAKLVLNAAPAAVGYYPRLGFTPLASGWTRAALR